MYENAGGMIHIVKHDAVPKYKDAPGQWTAGHGKTGPDQITVVLDEDR
jgi:GH24 family phage-related lysozyme (muramidase)